MKLKLLAAAVAETMAGGVLAAYVSVPPSELTDLTDSKGVLYSICKCHSNDALKGAFDNDSESENGRWLVNLSDESKPWVVWDFGKPTQVNGYRLKTLGVYYKADRNPDSFKLWGSNDLTNWTLVDLERDQASRMQEASWYCYVTAAAGSYRYYEFEVLAINPKSEESPQYCGIHELELLDVPAFNNVVGRPILDQDVFTYTGEDIAPTVAFSDHVQVSGSVSAKDIGEYEMTFTLDEGYTWEDSSTEPYTLLWSIVAIQPGEKIELNGSFETDSFIKDGNQKFGANNGTDAYTAGWTGGALSMANSAFSVPAAFVHGTYLMIVQGGNSISHEIEIPADGYYRLSLRYLRRPMGDNDGNVLEHKVEPKFGEDVTLPKLYNNIKGKGKGDYMGYVHTVLLKKGTTKLTIKGTAVSGIDQSTFIDEVELLYLSPAKTKKDPLEVGVPLDINGGFETGTKYNAASLGLTGCGNVGSGTAGTDKWGGTAYLSIVGSTYGVKQEIVTGTYCAIIQNSQRLDQRLCLGRGGWFTLSFNYCRREQYGDVKDQNIQIRIDDVTVATLSDNKSTTKKSWVTQEFRIERGTHTLTVQGTNPGGDNSTFVDNIVLMPTKLDPPAGLMLLLQ